MLTVTDAPTRYYYANQRVPEWLTKARNAVLAPNGNIWQNNQQAGVAYRELGISQLLLHPHNPEYAVSSFLEALRYLNTAEQHASFETKDDEQILALALIEQDAVLTRAFSAAIELKVGSEKFATAIMKLVESLDGISDSVYKLECRIAHHPIPRDEVSHCRMINRGIRARLCMMIGNLDDALFYFQAATRLGLAVSTSPDNEKAFRSVRIYQALALWHFGQKTHGPHKAWALWDYWQVAPARHRAWQALTSAYHNRDFAHIARALAVWLTGQHGENLLRRLRDRGC